MSDQPWILVVGYAAERTVAYTIDRLRRHGQQFTVLDLADYLETAELVASADEPGGYRISLNGNPFDMGVFSGVYMRFVDLREHRRLPRDMQARIHGKLAVLEQILDALPAKVINRPGRGRSNCSKPFQLIELRNCGFLVPPSYSTNMPDAPGLSERIAAGEVVYKSNSGIRSIVDLAGPDQLRSLSDLANCPALFQDRIVGPDLRVHMVGARAIGQLIRARTVDYRYPGPFDRVEYSETEVPGAVVELCRRFQAPEGLEFIAFDFKIDAEGSWYCLEANPMPGYDGFDERCGHRISDVLVDELRGD